MKSYLIYDITPIVKEIEYILDNEYLDDNKLIHINPTTLVETIIMSVMSDVHGIDFIGRRGYEVARVREVMSRMPSRVAGLIRGLPVPHTANGLVFQHWRRGDDLYLVTDHTHP